MNERARVLLRFDAAVEASCAAGVAAFAIADGRTGSWSLPTWLSVPLLWVIAVVFAATAVGLYVLGELVRSGAVARLSLLTVLGAVNAGLAVIVAVWAAGSDGFGGDARLAFLVAALTIFGLGAVQMVTFARSRPLDGPT